jgi:hypothetical protein
MGTIILATLVFTVVSFAIAGFWNWWDRRHPVPRAQILEMKPGDVLVVQYPGKLSEVAYQHLREQWKGFVPGGSQVVLVDDAIKVQVLRPTKAE